MKNLAIALLFVLPLAAAPAPIGEQYLDKETGKYTWRGVVQVSNASKDAIYNAAKEYFTHAFNSGKDVLQIDDKETGKIVGKGYYKAYSSFLGLPWDWGMVSFFVTIEMKDGKFRYTITDFSHVGGSATNPMNGRLQEWPAIGPLEQEKYQSVVSDDWNVVRKQAVSNGVAFEKELTNSILKRLANQKKDDF